MRPRLTLTASLLLGGLLTGCDGAPTQPGAVPAPTSAAQPSALLVDGPASVPPGETAAFKASARFADGSLRDVTQEALWTSSDPSIVSVASGGVATGHGVGEALVSYRLAAMESGRRALLVLPAGTYMLSGVARDGDAVIFGAHVELRGQTGAAIATTTTNWEGRYTLYGAPADATIRVTHDAFTEGVASLASAAGTALRRSLDVRLSRLGARADHSGSYVLDVRASCEPGNPFPESLRHRRYRAVLTQDARAHVTARLSGAEFFKFFPWSTVGNPGVLGGTASEGRARFALGDSWDWGVNADLTEKLPDQTSLVIHGVAELTATPTGLVGTLNGSFDLYPTTAWAVSMSCRSSAHQFVFTR